MDVHQALPLFDFSDDGLQLAGDVEETIVGGGEYLNGLLLFLLSVAVNAKFL